jgi:hypothetical protein
MAPPDFTDRSVFPCFADLPLAGPSAASSTSSASYYLIGQVKENMTITSPTLIITDLSGVDLAVTFASSTFDVKPYKKGKTCLVIPNAERTAPAAEGKKGFVRIEAGKETEVRCLPGTFEGLERFVDVQRAGTGKCAAEGCAEEGSSKCLGCGTVKYCGKVS